MIRGDRQRLQSWRVILAWIAVSICGSAFRPALGAEPAVTFNRDIRGILSDRCFSCHGPDSGNRQADLRLDRRESAVPSAIEPGKADESELIARIASNDPEYQMPPADSHKTPLSADEIQLLRDWINAGAEYEPHWSLVAPKRVAPPMNEDGAAGDDLIDAFLSAQQQRVGLEPAPRADAVTLARRLWFDLSGLPPTAAEVHDFAADTRPDAIARRVDVLLAAPTFGERISSYWFDLVRFANTVGYHGDQEHAIAPYRDYVIDAFNQNMPFDQFTKEQLAGDLLPDATIDQKIATGYNRVLQTSHEGGVQAKEYLLKYASDRVRNLSTAWMGLTMGCAECHDHKFDPLTQKDFYSLAAFFADIQEKGDFKGAGDSTPTKREPEIEVLAPADREELAVHQADLKSLEAKTKELRDKAFNKETSPDEIRASLLEVYKMQPEIARTKKRIAEIERRRRRTMVTIATEPRPVRILARGDWLDESGAIVGPAIPQVFGAISVEGRVPNRLDLAEWLTTPANPVVARVLVNRLWHLFYGAGLAKSLDDVGSQGTWPTHPELLDWLALELVESGWDIKGIVRTMVETASYERSSVPSPRQAQIDPDNRYFARQSRGRLPAEMVRDSALAISGLLVEEIGGAISHPYQPAGYYSHLNFPKREYKEDEGSPLVRRSLYTHWQRQYLHPMLKAFDAPSREECTAERQRSNTPAAALVLLNDPEFVECARALASRVLREAGPTTDERIGWLFQQAFTRDPLAEEREILSALADKQQSYFASQPDSARELVHEGRVATDAGLDPVELATWTSVCRVIFNLDESTTRN